MNPEAIQKIVDALEKNGGVVVEGIAANAATKAWGDLFLLPFTIAITVGLVSLARKWWKMKTEAPEGRDGSYELGSIIATIMAVIFFLATMISIYSIPSDIATIKNPKGAAIRILLEKR